MSISVDVFLRNDSGNLVILTTPPDESDLVGHDDTRHTLWGSPAVRALGATVVVGLSAGDVWVGFGQLDELVNDCDLILKHLPDVAAASGRGEDYIRFRVGNLRAADRAGQGAPGRCGDLGRARRPGVRRPPGHRRRSRRSRDPATGQSTATIPRRRRPRSRRDAGDLGLRAWSGRRESNSRSQFGRLKLYH